MGGLAIGYAVYTGQKKLTIMTATISGVSHTGNALFMMHVGQAGLSSGGRLTSMLVFSFCHSLYRDLRHPAFSAGNSWGLLAPSRPAAVLLYVRHLGAVRVYCNLLGCPYSGQVREQPLFLCVLERVHDTAVPLPCSIGCDLNQNASRNCGQLSCSATNSCSASNLSGTDCKALPTDVCDHTTEILAWSLSMVLIVSLIQIVSGYLTMSLRSQLLNLSTISDASTRR